MKILDQHVRQTPGPRRGHEVDAGQTPIGACGAARFPQGRRERPVRFGEQLHPQRRGELVETVNQPAHAAERAAANDAGESRALLGRRPSVDRFQQRVVGGFVGRTDERVDDAVKGHSTVIGLCAAAR